MSAIDLVSSIISVVINYRTISPGKATFYVCLSWKSYSDGIFTSTKTHYLRLKVSDLTSEVTTSDIAWALPRLSTYKIEETCVPPEISYTRDWFSVCAMIYFSVNQKPGNRIHSWACTTKIYRGQSNITLVNLVMKILSFYNTRNECQNTYNTLITQIEYQACIEYKLWNSIEQCIFMLVILLSHIRRGSQVVLIISNRSSLSVLMYIIRKHSNRNQCKLNLAVKRIYLFYTSVVLWYTYHISGAK